VYHDFQHQDDLTFVKGHCDKWWNLGLQVQYRNQTTVITVEICGHHIQKRLNRFNQMSKHVYFFSVVGLCITNSSPRPNCQSAILHSWVAASLEKHPLNLYREMAKWRLVVLSWQHTYPHHFVCWTVY